MVIGSDFIALVRPIVGWFVGVERRFDEGEEDGWSSCMWCSGHGQQGDTALAAIRHKPDCKVKLALDAIAVLDGQ
jgi:hypothetical protein